MTGKRPESLANGASVGEGTFGCSISRILVGDTTMQGLDCFGGAGMERLHWLRSRSVPSAMEDFIALAQPVPPEGSGSSGMEDCFVLAQPVPPGGLEAGGNENLDRVPIPSAAREVIMFEWKHSQATSGVALAERASSDATTSTRQPTRAEPVFGSTNVNACFSLTYRPAERIITVHRQTRQQTQRTKQR